MLGYRLLSEAKRELEAAVSFYDSEHLGLGRDFALEVHRLCGRIAESPLAGVKVRPDIRRRVLRRFPYSIRAGDRDIGNNVQVFNTYGTVVGAALCWLLFG